MPTNHPHGVFEIEIHGQRMVVTAHQDWNEEGAKLYIEAAKKFTLQLEKKPWVRIINLRDFQLGTPSTIQALQNFVIWTSEHNCQACLYIITGKLQKSYIDKITHIKEHTDLSIVYVASLQEALAWCDANGYAAE